MAATADHAIVGITTDDAVLAVLHETLDLLRAALASVLGDDDATAYGLGDDDASAYGLGADSPH